jgi:ATP-dependent DNA helicase DinG
MVMAVARKERTVITTESLGLQSQLIEKDLPVIARATKEVTGVAPSFAVLKGWGNFACTLAAVEQAQELTGSDHDPIVSSLLDKLSELGRSNKPSGRSSKTRRAADGTIRATQWALGEALDPESSGDKVTFDAVGLGVSDQAWQSLSTTSGECMGDECPYVAGCKPRAARARAAAADVVVTNHSMLAIQATKNVPVVVGSRSLGPVHHLVIDEAHSLASVVRQQGATEIGAASIDGILHAVERCMDRQARSLRASSVDLMRDLDSALAPLGQKDRGAVPADVDPFEEVGESLMAWLQEARATVPPPGKTRVVKEIRRRYRALSRIADLSAVIRETSNSPKEYAKWVEGGKPPLHIPASLTGLTWSVLKVSPVDVAPMLRAGVYNYQATPHLGGRGGDGSGADDGDGEDSEDSEDISMSVIAVSATLLSSAVVDLGLRCARTTYPSPFDRAYGQSMLFVPKLDADQINLLNTAPRGSRPRLGTDFHPTWALGYIERLVLANEGSALILAATSRAGQFYAEGLRKALAGRGIHVHSQWDGGSIRQVADAWRADHRSVLVGTKSLMTGVDAPGETCSLVVLDRVPRAPRNPVDEARVVSIQARLEIDKWAADRMVYVSDAALLMAQAAGRLIRSESDGGMVACLDPRLLKTSKMAYQEQSRKILIGTVGQFGSKVSSIEKAEVFLRERTISHTEQAQHGSAA